MTTQQEKKIAKERITTLFDEAKKASLREEMKDSDRYVELARKIGMRYNVSIPSEFRRRFCKDCYSYMLPGKTCRVRVRDKMVVSLCENCGHVNRLSYRKIESDKDES